MQPMLSRLLRPLLAPNRYRLVLVFATIFMLVALATRLALVSMQGALSINGPTAVVRALAAGTIFDAVAILWLSVPLVIYLLLVPERIFGSRAQRWLFWPAAGLALFGVLFTAIAELFFFSEFNSRFNFVAVDYLMYPTEVVENIWESYPTGLILATISVVSGLVLFALRRPLSGAWREPVALRWRAAGTLIFLLVLAAVSGSVSPSLARVSNDRALNEIATDGAYSFWGALRGSNPSFQGLYAERPSVEVFDRLHRLLAEPAADSGSFSDRSTSRPVHGTPPERSLNVVVVLEESLGSDFIGLFNPGGLDLTPNFDALTSEGALLTNAYSTGNRTIRAIEATTSSLPPLPGISIVRRPQSENLFTLPALLRERGYDTSFIYGGRALFDGMGGYLRRNGVDRIVDQGDFPDDVFRTAWGVADEEIFDRALVEMDASFSRGRPFYSLVLTVSNHRPYTFPTEHVTPDPELWPRENAVRYADWALGRFMRQARDHDFFEQTLFVLMGDHGARVYGAAEIPLASYEVPILFIAPGLGLEGRRLDTLASTMDVPPTVLGLLGWPYRSKFFGHDLFAISPGEGRALMTHNSEVALMRHGRLAVLGLHRSTALYERGEDGSSQTLLPQPDFEGRELIEDAIAYYQGADELYREGSYLLEESPAGVAQAGALVGAAPALGSAH